MQFLGDESCDGLIVCTLRTVGHDVTYVAELASGLTDEDVLRRAFEEKRILLTEDRDFCELVFRDAKRAFGIVLVRIPTDQRPRKAERITELVTHHGSQLPGSMTTLSLNSIRIRPLPGVSP